MTDKAAAKQDDSFFSEDQLKIIRDSFLSGATPQEAAMLMEVSKAMRLNPIKRQIFFVKRYDSQKRCEVWAFQVSIDGLRATAERTGQYDGQDEPEFEEGPNGTPRVAKVRVWRKGISRPFVGVAHWDEYVQKTRDGKTTHMWEKFKHVMLAKCAEALALRKAFPEELAGAYVPEEMSQDKDTEKASPPPKRGLEAIPSVSAPPVEKDVTPPKALPSDTEAALKASIATYRKQPITEMTVEALQAAVKELEPWLDNPANLRNPGREQTMKRLGAITAELAKRGPTELGADDEAAWEQTDAGGAA